MGKGRRESINNWGMRLRTNSAQLLQRNLELIIIGHTDRDKIVFYHHVFGKFGVGPLTSPS